MMVIVLAAILDGILPSSECQSPRNVNKKAASLTFVPSHPYINLSLVDAGDENDLLSHKWNKEVFRVE